MTVTKTRLLRAGALTALTLTLAAACDSGTGVGDDDNTTGGPGPDPTPTEYTPSGGTGECNVDALLDPGAYGNKVKALLTGLSLSDDELSTLNADPGALKGLVQSWVAMPEAEPIMRRFFMNAFQQTSLDRESFFYLLGRNAVQTGFYRNPNSPTAHEMINQNLSESFARTAIELVAQGRPFNEVLTTKSWMMTTAMMAYMAYIDDDVVDDEEDHTYRTTDGEFPTIRLVPNAGQAPGADALDPSSPDFMTFHHDRLDELPGSCNVTSLNTIDTTGFINGEWRINGNNSVNSPSYFVWSQMIGRHLSVRRHPNTCATGNRNNRPPLFQRNNDFDDWRMVDIVTPGGGNGGATKFYDLKALRNASSLKLHTPRVGFLSHPAFHGTWQTNEDNSARVSINQMLIVALGNSFDGEAVTDFNPNNLDEAHAAPGSECYGCHQTLDPMRDFVRASFTNFYGEQLDPERQNLEGTFVFGGIQVEGSGISSLATTLAEHPEFPAAWAQKLCFYANSEACPEGEELDRIVAAFVDENLDFTVLLTELFSSPLVTGSECVAGVDAGTRATIARRSQFCEQLSNRLGFDDICGLDALQRDATNLQNDVRDAVASVPDDTYSRAVVDPVMISETGMFARANREAACVIAAQQGYDQVFAEMEASDVIGVLVADLMALPIGDERHDEAVVILESHVEDALAMDMTEIEALQSAFVLACMSPGAAGVGF